MSGSLLGASTKEFAIGEPGQNRITMKLTEEYKTQTKEQTLNQSIEVVRRRIDEMGTREPTIERQGQDRILVQVPGLSDPKRLIELLGTTAKMTFQLVDETADVAQAARGIVPIGDVLLPQETKPGQPPLPPLVVQKRIMVSGDRLTNAQAGFNPQTSEPNVSFRFDSVGARQFGDVTKTNTGRRFAIVLDNKIISAPVIREPILGGSGQISGGFTLEEANTTAVLLRSGTLPGRLTVVEEQLVAPDGKAAQR
jgi:protein-export membrane protein SecD